MNKPEARRTTKNLKRDILKKMYPCHGLIMAVGNYMDITGKGGFAIQNDSEKKEWCELEDIAKALKTVRLIHAGLQMGIFDEIFLETEKYISNIKDTPYDFTAEQQIK